MAVDARTGGNRFTNADPWGLVAGAADGTLVTGTPAAAAWTVGVTCIGAGGGSLRIKHCRTLRANTRTQSVGAAGSTMALLCFEISKRATDLLKGWDTVIGSNAVCSARCANEAMLPPLHCLL